MHGVHGTVQVLMHGVHGTVQVLMHFLKVEGQVPEAGGEVSSPPRAARVFV